METIWKFWVWMLFLSFPFSVYAQESSLILYPSAQEIDIGQEFSVAIVGKALSNIAGGDITVVYDEERMQPISKQFLISQEEILDLQKENESIQEMQDEENRCKFLFALQKNAELLSGEEKTIAVIQFKAIKAGEAFVRLSGKSRWILEEHTCEPIEGEIGSQKMRFPVPEEYASDLITYRYESPQTSPKDVYISIAEERDPKPIEEPDEKENPRDQDAPEKNSKRKSKEYLPSVSSANLVKNAVFFWNDSNQLDALMYLFWRLNLIFRSEVMKYSPFPVMFLYLS